MTADAAVELTEDRVPYDGIEESIQDLVELYGGRMTAERDGARDFTLPLRRGMAASGAVECTIAWNPGNGTDGTVRLTCNRNVDAPKAQRVLLLVAGVAGALMFMLWPFYPGERAFGTFAWLGGVIAIAVYLMTLRRTSGGIAFDFLRRLAGRQRARTAESE
ncbi:MAG TPA: hypothetical protein VFO89_15590 [Thermoanaerobaculia bacterium]|nr:hypothetical protein [Thermoanaerobaculia bacterium]